MTLVLSQEELVELTDYRRPADQATWLAENGYPYEFYGDHLIVAHECVNKKRKGNDGPKLRGIAESSIEDLHRMVRGWLRDTPWVMTGQSRQDWFYSNAERLVVSPDEIVSRAEPYKLSAGSHDSGLYFIIEDGSIRYVGLSKRISERLSHHKRYSPFPVPAFSEIPGLPTEFLRDFEAFYIHLLMPPWNDKIEVRTCESDFLLDKASKGDLWRT